MKEMHSSDRRGGRKVDVSRNPHMTASSDNAPGAPAAPRLDRVDPRPAAPRPATIEARRHRRARAHWPIRLIGAGGAVSSGWVCDVSEGGVGIMSGVNMPVGSVLDIALAIPHPKDARRNLPLQAKVRVVFSAFCGTQSRLGVQFVVLAMDARVAIRDYVIAHS